MSDETIDDIEDDEPDLEEEEDLDEDLDLDDDLALDDVVDDTDDEDADPKIVEPTAKSAGKADDDEDVLELDEEHHPDDIEDPLDVLLKERTASASLEDEEEEAVEEIDTDDRGEGPTKIVPRRPDEFLCTSCFLVRPRALLADEERMLCRDCA